MSIGKEKRGSDRDGIVNHDIRRMGKELVSGKDMEKMHGRKVTKWHFVPDTRKKK